MNESASRIKGLGEVSLRVQNLTSMQKFYEDVVGLQVLRRDENFIFFKIAEGYSGHSQNLALFDANELNFLENKSIQVNPNTSSLHHIALNIDLEDFLEEKKRLEGLGLTVQVAEHSWIQVRSLYFSDPEGNLLELVCFDEDL
jgi:catechol-2,3-dioxygenase